MTKSRDEHTHEYAVISGITHEVLEFLAMTVNTRATFRYSLDNGVFAVDVDAERMIDEEEDAE